MRVGVIYLGRRGSGGAIALDASEHLVKFCEVFSVVNSRAENISQWKDSQIPYLLSYTYDSMPGALWSILFPRRIRELAERIAEYQPDVLFFPMFHPWNSTLQASMKDAPGVIVVHDPDPHPGIVDFFYSLLETRSMQLAKRCVILSENLRSALEKRGVLPDKISIIPMPEHSYYRDRYPSVPQGQPDRLKLLFFGRITPYKGLDVLLQAYHLIDPDTRPPLWIVGEGNLKPYWRLMNGLSGVHVENRWISEDMVSSYFQPGTIVVLPYTSASQSGVLEIAASFGLPVIASRVGGIPGQIRDGESGLLVDPGDPLQLRGAIERLVEDQDLARRLGERLKYISQSERNWDIVAREIHEVCQRASRRNEGHVDMVI